MHPSERSLTADGLFEIRSCEVCGSRDLSTVLDLGRHPMCDDLVAVGDSRTCREYPIEVMLCSGCMTAHQRFQIPKRELFPGSYHYRARFTLDVLGGMQDLIASLERHFGSISGKLVLDVGCNDGSLLGFARARGAMTAGVEPTDAAFDAEQQGHFVVHDYFTVDVAKRVLEVGTPDVIAFTNVFAHIENLGEVLLALSQLIGDETVLVIENHYLGSVLERTQFDTFYHEHPRSYSYTSFTHVASSLDLRIAHVEFPSRYGGNIRVFLTRKRHSIDASEVGTDLLGREARFEQGFVAMTERIDRWRNRKSQLLTALIREHGPLRAKAFPGRAAILVKLLDLTEESLVATFEKPRSLKIGHYVPGTRIPIVSDDVLFAMPDQDEPIVNLAWHISREIREYLTNNGYSGSVLDVLSESDYTAS